ncbi:hypothetical protein GGI35DRAFT_461035 [Trichoderma velutinum]
MGVTLCNRCQSCARRKIKCDENWPVCGYCQRKGFKCSGQPTNRFVYIKGPNAVRSLLREGSCAMSHPVQLPKSAICPSLGNEADGAIAQLIAVIDASRDMNLDALLSKKSFSLLPRYMISNQVLCNAVRFMVSCYTNHQRGIFPQELFDRRAYSQALRSLAQALQTPSNEISTPILAAISIIHRVVTTYEPEPEISHNKHLEGINAIMAARGPPNLDDDLDVSLMFDNFRLLNMDSLLYGRPNVYHKFEWQTIMNKALDCQLIESKSMTEIFRLSARLCRWCGLVAKLRGAQQTKNSRKASALAAEISIETTMEMNSVRILDHLQVTEMRDRGVPAEQADPLSPFLTYYQFPNPADALCFVLYATARIGICRLANQAMSNTTICDPVAELEITGLSHRIAKCIRYFREFKPLDSGGIVVPLVLAFEACNGQEREFIINALYGFEDHKDQLQDRWSAERIVSWARTITGR